MMPSLLQIVDVRQSLQAPSVFVHDNVAESFLASAFDGVDKIVTGFYDLEVIATDVAGNKSTALSVTGVTVDVSDIALTRRFPTKDSFGLITESRRDTLNSETVLAKPSPNRDLSNCPPVTAALPVVTANWLMN